MKHTKQKLDLFDEELDKLVITDKSALPVAISAQDRSGMTFPHTNILPLIQKALITFKEFLNPQCYRKYGPKLIEVTTISVTNNVELQSAWMKCTESLLDEYSGDDIVGALGKVFILKMLHSQCKEYFVAMRSIETVDS